MTATSFNKIEETLAHHEKTINDLNDMVNAQWKEIERLKVIVDRAQAKITSLENRQYDDGETGSVADQAAADKPPHY